MQYQPLKGSSYIPLPATLAIVNVQNLDQKSKCFMWLILAALYPKQGQHNNPNRVGNYTSYHDDLDFKNIPFPVRVADVPKFERKNDIRQCLRIRKAGDLPDTPDKRKRTSTLVERRHIFAGSKTSTYYSQIKTAIKINIVTAITASTDLPSKFYWIVIFRIAKFTALNALRCRQK